MTTYAPVRTRPMPRRVPMDPRVKARRVAVTRAAGRRRLHRLLWVLAGLAIAALGTGAVLSPLLDVNQIAVVGVDGAHADEVRAATGIEAGEALMLVDTGAAVAGVQALSWVAEARVARQLPGTLRVEVTPRFAVAWQQADDGQVRVFDRRGVAITEAPTAPAGLPELASGGAHVGTTARVASALTSTLRPSVWSIRVEHGLVFLKLYLGPEVRLGDATDLRAKVQAAEAMLAEVAGTVVGYIDVSVPSAPVVG